MGLLAQFVDVGDGDQCAVADDADPVAGLLDLAEHVRGHEHGLPVVAGLLDEFHELLLQERVQPTGRFVEYEQVRCVHEGLDEADLLPVAFGQGADAVGQIEIESVGERVDPGDRYAAAELAEVGEQLAAGLVAVDDEVAGEVADAGAGRHRVAGAATKNGQLSGGRTDEVEHEPDRGGLAGTVGAEKPEHLAAADGQVKAVDGGLRIGAAAVAFDQRGRFDG